MKPYSTLNDTIEHKTKQHYTTSTQQNAILPFQYNIVFNDILCIVWNEKCKLNCFVSSGPMCQYIYKVCRPANPWENFYCKDICESPGFECVKFVNILTKSTPVRASSYNPKPKFVNYVFIILSCLRRTL